MGKSISGRGDYRRTPTTDVENYFDERELRDEFSALIANYTARQLAHASGCTTDAAKMWLAARRVPNLASTFNMARRMPVVRDWVQSKIGVSAAADAQREALRQMVAEEVSAQVKKPPAESAWHPDNVVRDLFSGRKRA